MMHYRDWTATQVRDWLIEAASTVRSLPRANGPKKSGNCHPEIVRESWKDTKSADTDGHARHVSSSFAIARMEAVWSWVNDLPREEDRRLMYEWAEAKALGKGYLAVVMERNELTERTLRRAVLCLCQRIADGLNRKHEIRLTIPLDPVSEISDPVRDFSVASKYCAAAPKTPKAMKTWDAVPTHSRDPQDKAEFAKHLKAVNRSRANRQKREAERRAKKRQKQAA